LNAIKKAPSFDCDKAFFVVVFFKSTIAMKFAIINKKITKSNMTATVVEESDK
jgi:hypothetical protein